MELSDFARTKYVGMGQSYGPIPMEFAYHYKVLNFTRFNKVRVNYKKLVGPKFVSARKKDATHFNINELTDSQKYDSAKAKQRYKESKRNG